MGEQSEDATTAACEAPDKPPNFRTPESIDYFLYLIKSDKAKRAGEYLVEMFEDILASNIHIQEKINHLIFLPRLLQRGGATKHGARKLLRKAGMVERNIKGIELPAGGAFVDFGCGAHDPVALATYYYANGFKKAYAIDLLPPRNELYSALAMYDILASIRLFPERYCRPGVTVKQLLKRLSVFNITAFEDGNFSLGMESAAGKVCYEPVDILELSIEPESVSVLFSSAVLEHVSDIDGVCKKIYDGLMPGGVAFHFIDMADHRSYRRGSECGPLSFLTEEIAPKNMNRLRKSEQLAAQHRAGFEIIKLSSVNAELTDDIRSKLVERFRGLDDDDVSTIKMSLTVRKPDCQL